MLEIIEFNEVFDTLVLGIGLIFIYVYINEKRRNLKEALEVISYE